MASVGSAAHLPPDGPCGTPGKACFSVRANPVGTDAVEDMGVPS
jgi:hypothetical protein